MEIQKYTIRAGPSLLLEALNPKPAYSHLNRKSMLLVYLYFLQIFIEHLICARVESRRQGDGISNIRVFIIPQHECEPVHFVFAQISHAVTDTQRFQRPDTQVTES